MKFGIPQIIMIVLYAMNLGIALVKHGEYKANEKYNFWSALIGTLVGMTVLYCGGFFG